MFLYFQTLLLLVHAAPTKVLVHFCFSGCLSYLVAAVICASFLTRCAGGLKTVTSQRHGWQPPGALRFSTAWTHGGRHFSQCSESFFEHDGFNEQSWGVQIGCARVHCCPLGQSSPSQRKSAGIWYVVLEIRCTERIGVGSIGVKAVSFFTGLASEGDGVDGTRWKNWELRGFCASENDSALESLGDGWKLSLSIGDSAYFKDLPFGTYTRRWDDDMVTLGRTILALAPLSSEFRCMNESRWGHATPRMVQHRIARNNIFIKPVCQCTTSTWWVSACTFNHTFTAAAAAKINEPFARFLCDSLHQTPKKAKTFEITELFVYFKVLGILPRT